MQVSGQALYSCVPNQRVGWFHFVGEQFMLLGKFRNLLGEK